MLHDIIIEQRDKQAIGGPGLRGHIRFISRFIKGGCSGKRV